jgi:hypothetical protein
LVKRFYSLNTDMDMELFGEAQKFGANPLITARADKIREATSQVLTNTSNPENALQAEKTMAEIQHMENQDEAAMVQAKGVASQADKKNRPLDYSQAMGHAEVGPSKIVQWLTTNPDGIAVLNTEGGMGASMVLQEKKIAEGAILKKYPNLSRGDDEFDAKVAAQQPKWMMAGALRFIEKMSPADLEMVKQQAPQFFEDEKPSDVAVVNDERMPPETRDEYTTTWKKHAATWLDAYMLNPDNDPSVDAVMDAMDEWLSVAIFGETDEPHLAAVTAARGKGTKTYTDQVREEVPAYIRANIADLSSTARELNPEEAKTQDLLGGRHGPRGVRQGRKRQKAAEAKKKKGILP